MAALGNPCGSVGGPGKPLDIQGESLGGPVPRVCSFVRVACGCLAFAMPLPCVGHAIAMRVPCVCYAFAMPLPCLWHAFAKRLPCACHALLCVRHALGVLLPCACHVFVMRVAPKTAQKFKKSYTRLITQGRPKTLETCENACEQRPPEGPRGARVSKIHEHACFCVS